MESHDSNPLSLSTARFIKLGERGSGIDKHCIESGSLYIGFSSSDPRFFDLAIQRDWDRYKELLLEYEESRSISGRAKIGNATKATNQVKAVFEADVDTLWVTFYGGYLWHGSIRNGANPKPDSDLKGCLSPIVNGWSNCDTKGNLLKIENLAGSLTKIQGFQGTSCELKAPEIEYLKRRLNGSLPAFINEINTARSLMVKAVSDAIKTLQPKDFELLVEILFSRTWRRIGRAGGSLRFVDITFEDPMYPDKCIAVQVKSATSLQEVKRYLSEADTARYSQFYIVYHTLLRDLSLEELSEDNLILIDCDRLSDLVVDSGLTHWLIEKTS